jgi:hypothetical protein
MATRALARPIIVSLPRRRGRIRRAGARVVRAARRGGHHAKRALPTVGVGLGALVVGYMSGKGFLDRLPQIGGSRVITLGVAGWAATRFFKNPSVRQAGLAALASALFDFGKVQAGGTSGFEDGMSGDAGAGPGGGAGY